MVTAMICEYCGAQLDTDATVCPVCGNAVEEVKQVTASKPDAFDALALLCCGVALALVFFGFVG